MRLTVGQAVVRFLAAQYSERDGVERRFFAGCFGIFGHGNVAGMGQALLEHADDFPYYMARNEQAMVHAASGYARMSDRLSTFACTTSIGPGATNMVTGAALATVNRLPVLLLPGDVFATRAANPVLQELEDARSFDVSVNDCFKPVSRYWDRINRPEQLPGALLAAMRVLTDPAETGAVTLALPQDVQAEALEWPEELFVRRVWRIARPVPEPAALDEAAAILQAAERPLIVAGGGVIYSGATEELRAFAERTGIPVAETQAGKGALPWEHACSVGAIGATGTTAANALAREADVVVGIGTRYSDFTTASHSLFANPAVKFINVNVARFDAAKLAGCALVADAREGIRGLNVAVDGYTVPDAYRDSARALTADWNAKVDQAYAPQNGDLLTQAEVIGAVNDVSEPQDVVVCAAGSMPGDLHKLWRARDPKGYHVEYGYSCMGYEIAGGLGVKMAAPDREVFVMVGDGSYLMMAQELTTAVAEGIKLVVVLVQNHGYASIGNLSESVGADRFGTRYRARTATGLDGATLPVDLAANAASLGADVIRASTADDLRDALHAARKAARTTVIHIETNPLAGTPDSAAWWDVPVAEVSALDSTREARARYEEDRRARRRHL
ncbi:3D-(3,5/4)-trihydroxycyclohexane-1,2-dione acylhydrolase (decyclizing) [Actinomadura darangshiensis]|uniref:3D-(3,5/4)-trihydroxycyclohexane-1,2-dione acylhydrolase (Decyclizing) n=1 Tax=Actinomadura darangshiensis TaxID=705336 RepID=A0A4R5B1K9_9ACTN|nr:3D-(3,5/4)-trihydroxycyclohexane-1,2-dione acylhydrolase (decyclizing) [Actinomadura darangshiensis]TDD79948.1 3D-(3,5/4)-trihydroxycyclohexane-1,2-dione acylhydrolase (decyclizing) [Actinomadura darangshiensis]